MTSDCVWYCSKFTDTRDYVYINKPFEEGSNEWDVYRENIKRFSRGEAINLGELPSKIYNTKKGKPYNGKRYLAISGLWTVSQAVFDVMSRFEMGLTNFHPVEVFEPDKETRVDGTYYFLTFGNRKDALVHEESKVKISLGAANYRPVCPWDHGLTFSAAALEGPDVWMDAQLDQVVFFSDRLVRALKKSKLATKFRLYRSQISLLGPQS